MNTYTEDTTLLEANGYIQLTHEYTLPAEEELLARAMAQLEKNSRTYVLAKNDIGVAIWVKKPFGAFQLTEYSRKDVEVVS
jgi:hypothetical protein